MTRQDSYRFFGDNNVYWSNFGNDIYRSALVRSCIRPLAEHTSKLNVHVYRKYFDEDGIEQTRTDDYNNRLERLIRNRPNPYMSGSDFLKKVRILYEKYNNSIIFIDKNDFNEVVGLYPVPFNQLEVREYGDELFFLFWFRSRSQPLIATLEELAILRKDYAENLLFGEPPDDALRPLLDLIHTSNEGAINTIKTSVNLRGLLKSTKGMLSDADRKATKEAFVSDYLSIENESGVAMLDSTLEYTPLTAAGKILDAEQTKEQREDVYRYFGVNDEIIMSKYSSVEWEAFYESQIETFALALSQELTNKIYTEREIAFGNMIVFASDRLLYMSTSEKLALQEQVDRGILNRNEVREVLGKRPYPGGGEFVMRAEYVNALPAATVEQPAEAQEGEQTVDSLLDNTQLATAKAEISEVSLNGAQITSLLTVVQAVAKGEFERESAIILITSAFPFSEETAQKILGTAGGSFTLDKDKGLKTDRTS